MEPLVIPVLFSSERKVVQTTSGRLSHDAIAVRCLEPPRLGSRVSMALQLPDGGRAEVVVGDVSETTRSTRSPEPGFTATFIDLPSLARRRIDAVLARAAQEKRTFPRLAANIDAHVAGGARHIRDISAVGLFVNNGFHAAPGDALDLLLELPDGRRPAATKALVVRSLGDGAGMQFVDSTREFRLRLDRYLGTLG